VEGERVVMLLGADGQLHGRGERFAGRNIDLRGRGVNCWGRGRGGNVREMFETGCLSEPSNRGLKMQGCGGRAMLLERW
jgi:hypothetical protein